MDDQIKTKWSEELAVKVFKLKFENDALFKNSKQPWGKKLLVYNTIKGTYFPYREFYKKLLETGFPKEISAKQVMRKWTTAYHKYLAVRKKKHTSWIFYNLFESVYGKSSTFDKYESWSYDWRIRLINSISKAKELNLDFQRMWKKVERSMRKLRLPSDCYIQDIKGLWSYMKGMFGRKHRLKLRKGSTDWPLHDAMLNYYEKFDPDYLAKMEEASQGEPSLNQSARKYRKEIGDEDFEWTQDNTETFIQLRLQNDWLFREKKCNWNDILAVMIEEFKFPGSLTSRDLFRKWASIYYEHHRAKAMNDKSWAYYNLFELYLGESNLNPLVDWQEEWVFNLISARTDLHPLFKSCDDQIQGWREVEKKLRNIGIPLDHSLLDIPEIWTHLWRTFKLKRKLANKGQLNEHWPYYDAMNYYYMLENASEVEMNRQLDDDDEDDVRPKLKKPKNGRRESNVCRSCYNDDGCLDIFEEKDAKGINLAYKLKVVGGVKVERTDGLPRQICVNCAEELENAYKFRAKCLVADHRLRNKLALEKNKEDTAGDENDNVENETCEEISEDNTMDVYFEYEDEKADLPAKENKDVKPKRKYVYRKICEKCGKCVRNMYAHKDVHSTGKTYSCDVCGKTFKFRSGMMLHRDVHNPKPRKTCEVCGKVFFTLLNFRNHRVHHENKRRHKCETCGKRFNTSTTLKMHMSSHSDERPFTCHECGKAFKWVQNLRKHLGCMHKDKEQ